MTAKPITNKQEISCEHNFLVSIIFLLTSIPQRTEMDSARDNLQEPVCIWQKKKKKKRKKLTKYYENINGHVKE